MELLLAKIPISVTEMLMNVRLLLGTLSFRIDRVRKVSCRWCFSFGDMRIQL